LLRDDNTAVLWLCVAEPDAGRAERVLPLPLPLACERWDEVPLEWLEPSLPFLAVFEGQRGPRLSVDACRATRPFELPCAGLRSRACTDEWLK
jgi:hypothetical protein